MERKDEINSTNESEVTSEMIEAAREIFEEDYAGEGRYAISDELIARAYSAMHKLQRSP
jgi:hypothetical protein